MSVLSPSTLETANYGSDGWNAIYSSNFQKINNIWRNIECVVRPASQEEATYDNLDAVRNKIFIEYFPIIELAVGTNSLDLSNIFTPITIKGDTRDLVGITWMHGKSGLSNKATAGAGIVGLTNAGNDITIACTSSNPDLSTLVSGDFVVICDTAGNITKREIASVSGNTITLTGTAPTVNANGASITALPNRIVDSPIFLSHANFDLIGLAWDGLTDDFAIGCDSGEIVLTNCCFYDVVIACLAKNIGKILFNASENSIVKCTNGICAEVGGCVVANTISIVKASSSGFFADVGGKIDAKNSLTSYCISGFRANGTGAITAKDGGAQFCTTGYKADNCAFIDATNTSGNNTSNTANTATDATSAIIYS